MIIEVKNNQLWIGITIDEDVPAAFSQAVQEIFVKIFKRKLGESRVFMALAEKLVKDTMAEGIGSISLLKASPQPQPERKGKNDANTKETN